MVFMAFWYGELVFVVIFQIWYNLTDFCWLKIQNGRHFAYSAD